MNCIRSWQLYKKCLRMQGEQQKEYEIDKQYEALQWVYERKDFVMETGRTAGSYPADGIFTTGTDSTRRLTGADGDQAGYRS